jgi:low affinity Fe/Cu permease
VVASSAVAVSAERGSGVGAGATPREPRTAGPGPFLRLSRQVSDALGRPVAFAVALAVVILWAVSGPLFHFNDVWQLTINTGTTIITFLMLFLVQSTQNRQGEAIQIKLDELIRATRRASNRLVDLEDASEDEVRELHARYQRLAEEAKAKLSRPGEDAAATNRGRTTKEHTAQTARHKE